MTIFAKTTVEDIRKSFPTTEITAITKRPTYPSLKPLLKGIRKCAESVASLQAKGHLYLVVTAAEFTAITTETAVIPTAPSLNPPVLSTDTQFVLQEKRAIHARLVEAYQLHITVSDALKREITENVDKMYLADIEIASSTVLEIITYLKARYYKISTAEIQHNDRMLRELWNTEEPIEAYFRRVKECIEFAGDAADADDITPKTQIQIMLPSMERVVEFKHHVREWKRKATKTPELFRTHFIEAYEEMLDEEEEAQEQEQEEGANNAYTSEDIQKLLDAAGLGQTQSDQQQHANMSTGTSETAKMLDLIAKLTDKVSALESAPRQRERRNVGNGGKGAMAWRREPLKEGDPVEKTVDGKKYKHCQNCNQGKGLWTVGLGLHGTSEHDPTKSRNRK